MHSQEVEDNFQYNQYKVSYLILLVSFEINFLILHLWVLSMKKKKGNLQKGQY